MMNPSMRLKLKGDAFFLPDSNNGVYFRNNTGSFRMEGEGIEQWIEKLLPMFSGKYTLAELTDGLPAMHRNRVYEIAESLYRNGFVRDICRDLPHQLPNRILKSFASQIEFLDSFGDSGAYRFQTYRQTKVLAVGSGPFLLSLAAALFESGLPGFHILLNGEVPTNRQRLTELVAHARAADPEAAVEESAFPFIGGSADYWDEAVQPYDWVLYVSQVGRIRELLDLQSACKKHKKMLIPAVRLQQAGMAGPIVHPDAEGDWESAWRRVHRTSLEKDPQLHVFSSTAAAMLANVIVFELFKAVTGAVEPELSNKVFLLDLETLEGGAHPFFPHPLAAGTGIVRKTDETEFGMEEAEQGSRSAKAVRMHDGDGEAAQGNWRVMPKWSTPDGFEEPIQGSQRPIPERMIHEDDDEKMDQGSVGLFAYFGNLTSKATGIFHIWEEGELNQLPLAQCRVQAVDPLSEGPAELLPALICADLTHQGARREAGLAGLEAYASRLAERILIQQLPEFADLPGGGEHGTFVGIGAGETAAEGIGRGLQKCLVKRLERQLAGQPPNRNPRVFPAREIGMEDERCRFYWLALTTLYGAPEFGWGEEVCGFPVAWAGVNGRWYGCPGLNKTLAMRQALQYALLRAQNEEDPSAFAAQALECSSVELEDQAISILSGNESHEAKEMHKPQLLRSALEVLKQNGMRIAVFDLAVEPFMREGLAGVFGVQLLEEGSG